MPNRDLKVRNIGLIGSLTTMRLLTNMVLSVIRIVKVDKENRHRYYKTVEYLSADDEEPMVVAQANEPLDEDGRFLNKKVAAFEVSRVK